MIEDIRTDEELLKAHYNGDYNAMEILVLRYQSRIWACAYRNSNYLDKSFIDDLTQIAVYTVLRIIKSGNFSTQDIRAFEAWVFDITKKTTYTENRRHGYAEKGIDKEYLETFTADLQVRMPEESADTTEKQKMLRYLKKALGQLDPLDRKLCELRAQGRSYDEICREPEFKDLCINNNSGQLRTRYCRIIQTIRRGYYGT